MSYDAREIWYNNVIFVKKVYLVAWYAYTRLVVAASLKLNINVADACQDESSMHHVSMFCWTINISRLEYASTDMSIAGEMTNARDKVKQWQFTKFLLQHIEWNLQPSYRL